MKVGDLVQYENPEEGFAVDRVGIITDVMEFEDGSFPMYEVICTDPYDRGCLLYTSPSPRDATLSRMPSSA